jgi:hypothetical protein
MPDGTILVLEAVTVGTRHRFEHWWVPQSAPLDWLLGSGAVKYTEEENTPIEQQVLWFTRRHAKTGEQLDFDWFETCVAIDDRGWRIEEQRSGRDARRAHGHSSYGGSAPIASLSPGAYRTIVFHCGLPPFRCNGPTFKLQVFGTGNALVAEFDVPTTNHDPILEWTPEPLPVTKTDRDLSVTLTGLACRPRQFLLGARADRPDLSLEPLLEVRRNGELTADWDSIDAGLSDALGNKSGTWDCQLSPLESAWKLSIRLFRAPTSTFEASEQVVVENIELPASGNVRVLTDSLTVGAATLALQAVGNGKVVYTETVSRGHSDDESIAGGFVGKTKYQIEQRDHGAVRTTTVDAVVPHVRFRVTGLDRKHRFHLRITDDQGREIIGRPEIMGETHYQLLAGVIDVKSITIIATVHEGREVEFVVAPPEEFRAAPTKGDKEAQ